MNKIEYKKIVGYCFKNYRKKFKNTEEFEDCLSYIIEHKFKNNKCDLHLLYIDYIRSKLSRFKHIDTRKRQQNINEFFTEDYLAKDVNVSNKLFELIKEYPHLKNKINQLLFLFDKEKCKNYLSEGRRSQLRKKLIGKIKEEVCKKV